MNVAGAYWRGDENNHTAYHVVYGDFFSQAERSLTEYLEST